MSLTKRPVRSSRVNTTRSMAARIAASRRRSGPRGHAVRGAATCVVGMLLASLLASCSSPPSSSIAASGRPNIVFILTDDLSANLVTQQFMPNLWGLMKQGATFSNYFVTDSQCCPSRSSIFTGRFPHDTGVFTNTGNDGGYPTFQRLDDEASTVATDLKTAGYTTGMMGKYLNQYGVSDKPGPGWDTWDVVGNGYHEFNYTIREQGNDAGHSTESGTKANLAKFGGPGEPGKDNYLTDVLSGLATNFVTNAAQGPKQAPFFLEVATFAPHAPYVEDPKYVKLYHGMKYPRTPAFNAVNTDPPKWLAGQKPLTPLDIATINYDFRLRAEDMKSVDNMIGNLVATLKRTGKWSNTYFVFSSDNGLHMGEHRLTPGKMTAFDTDIHVPLIIVGPHVQAATTVTPFAQNIDFRSTFDAWAGTKPSEGVDGRSLLPLLAMAPGAQAPAGWPQGVLIEHHGPDLNHSDPDFPGASSGNPSSYEALRMNGALFVEYADGQHEFYNLVIDPYELHNIYTTLSSTQDAALHSALASLEACRDSSACSAVKDPLTS